MKYALVTGGSRGIGREICLKLSELGYAIIVNYLSNESKALEVKQLIEEKEGAAELLPFDVADEAAVDKAISQWEQAHPEDTIEVLVNNAGIRSDNLMVFMEPTDWHKIINIHLNGFFNVTHRLLKKMLRRKWIKGKQKRWI